MAYDILKLDKVVDQVKNEFEAQFSKSNAFVASVSKKIIPKGTKQFTVPIPASMTAYKRTAGEAVTAGTVLAASSFTASANTEYATGIKIDNLDAVETEYQMDKFQAVEAASTIISKLNVDLWALANSAAITNSVGTPGTVPAITILNQAKKILFDNKVPTQSQRYAIIGSDEELVWGNAMTVTDYGTIANENKISGNIVSPFGFNLKVDQDRPGTSDTDAVNIAFHPSAFMVGYRSQYIARPGQILSQAKTKDGITIFAMYLPYDDDTGSGMEIKFFIVAKPVIAYAPWAVKING